MIPGAQHSLAKPLPIEGPSKVQTLGAQYASIPHANVIKPHVAATLYTSIKNHFKGDLDYCYPKWTNQIASLEVTIRDAGEALVHASVVTRCQPFKMPRPIACVCARSRLDALSRKLRNLESPLVEPSLRSGRRQPRALGSLNSSFLDFSI